MPLHPPLLPFANTLPLTLLTYVCVLPPLPTLQLKTLLLPPFIAGKWTLERGGVGDVTFEKAPGIGHPPVFLRRGSFGRGEGKSGVGGVGVYIAPLGISPQLAESFHVTLYVKSYFNFTLFQHSP